MELGGRGRAGSRRIPHALHKAITSDVRNREVSRSSRRWGWGGGGAKACRWSANRDGDRSGGEGRTRARYGSHDHGHGRRGRSRPTDSSAGTKTRLERSHNPGHGVSWEPQNMLGHWAKSKAKGQPRHQQKRKVARLASRRSWPQKLSVR